MASTKKSEKEETKIKTKQTNSKSSSSIKETPLKSANKSKDKSKIKKPNDRAKESAENDSIISSSTSDSIEEVEEINSMKETPKKTPIKNQNKSAKRKQENEEEEEMLCRFPMARIKRIIKTEDIGSKLSNDVVFLINKATEMFTEQFCEEAYERMVRDRKKSLAYKQLASVVNKERRFDFLSDFVPEQLKAEEALRQISLTENGQK